MRLADNSKTTDGRCLAIDLGAGSGRLVVGEILGAGWKLEEVARFRTPTRISAEYGYQCWETDQILTTIERHLSLVVESRKPTSFGVDSWGVDYVLLDDELRLVGIPAKIRASFELKEYLRGPCVPESVSRRFDELLSAREVKGEAYA